MLNGDDENLRALGPMAWTRVVRVGVGEGNDVRIEGFAESPEGASFAITWRGAPWARVRWALGGLFNVRNAAMAATAVGLALHPERPAALDLSALAGFRGVKRRQETRLSGERLTVIEDFGHHPTAIGETLRSLRARHPGARLTAVFEARSNTSRTKSLQGAFQEALALADEVYLGAVSRADRIPAAERFDPPAVVANLEARGVTARSAPTNAELLERLKSDTVRGEAGRRLVVFFTNGSFDGIIDGYVAAARGT